MIIRVQVEEEREQDGRTSVVVDITRVHVDFSLSHTFTMVH